MEGNKRRRGGVLIEEQNEEWREIKGGEEGVIIE